MNEYLSIKWAICTFIMAIAVTFFCLWFFEIYPQIDGFILRLIYALFFYGVMFAILPALVPVAFEEEDVFPIFECLSVGASIAVVMLIATTVVGIFSDKISGIIEKVFVYASLGANAIVFVLGIGRDVLEIIKNKSSVTERQ